MPYRITTYTQAFDLINVKPNDRIKSILKRLESEGRKEKSICFAIWKSHEKIMQFRGDSRFYSILENEIKKWSWGCDDPRWNDYNKRKEEEAKAAELEVQTQKLLIEEQKQRDKEFLFHQRYPGYVYFIQGETGGPIKIGYTADVKARLYTLQTGHPDILKVLFAFPGSQDDEKAIHEIHKCHRMRGEWFKPVEEIFTTIDELKIKPLPQVSDLKYDTVTGTYLFA